VLIYIIMWLIVPIKPESSQKSVEIAEPAEEPESEA
jgi:hypothetical protein